MKKTRVYRDAPKSMVPVQHNSPTLLDFHPLEVRCPIRHTILAPRIQAARRRWRARAAEQLARQMTLADWCFFSAIPNHEYFKKVWAEPMRPDGSLAAPHVLNYIERFNEVHRAVLLMSYFLRGTHGAGAR